MKTWLITYCHRVELYTYNHSAKFCEMVIFENGQNFNGIMKSSTCLDLNQQFDEIHNYIWLFFFILHFIMCIIHPCVIECIKPHRSCMVSVFAPSVVDRGFEHRSCMVSLLAISVVHRGFDHWSCMVSVIAPNVVDRGFLHRSCMDSVLTQCGRSWVPASIVYG